MKLDREKTIDALIESIGSEDIFDLFVDALVNGRVGFKDMSDAELCAACETWDVEPVERP